MYLNRLIIIIGFITCVLFGQSQNTLWKPVRISKIESGKAAKADKSLPNKYALVSLDEKQLSSLLAPLSVKGSKPASIELPLPNGQTIKVLAKESSIWQNGTNPLIPDVKTYQLINPSNHSNAGRMTVTKEGVSGILFNNNTNIYISPYVKGGGRAASGV